MSDFDQTSLHEELEVRVIALLTGELKESEADELEKILAINPELSAFRDRMAGLMGELHQASDELATPESEPPRRLSDERRARIFGDPNVLECATKPKRSQWKATLWGIAAAVCMLFFLFALITPSFQKVRSYSGIEAMKERVASESGPPSVQESSSGEAELNVLLSSEDYSKYAASDVAEDVDSRSVYGQSSDASVASGRSGRDEFAIDQVETEWLFDFDRTIPVDIPEERIEGTPQAITVPNLEPAPTTAPRMVVADERAGDVGAVMSVSEQKFLEVDGNDLETTGFSWEAEERKKGGGAVPVTRNPAAKSLFQNPTIVSPSQSGVVGRSRKELSGKDEAEVAKLRKEGRRDFLNGDYDTAAAAFEEVSDIDPDNVEAKLFSNRIDSIRGVEEGAMGHESMLTEVDMAWETPHFFKDNSDNSISSESDSAFHRKLNEVVIPQVNFSGMPLSKVVETIEELSAVYDPEEKGVKLEYKPVDEDDPKVNMSLRNLNVDRILQFVTQQVNYSYDVGSDAITIQPSSSLAGVSNYNTEFIPISRAALQSLIASSDGGAPSEAVVNPFAPPSVAVPDEETRALQGFFQSAGVNYELPGTSLAFDGEHLIVTQTRRNIERIRTIVRHYEKKRKAEEAAQYVRLTPKPEKLAAEEPFSTFSLNISDVSFKLAQAALENSRMPPSSQIRTEEFVNSFDYGDPAPRPDEAVSLNWEIALHPFEHDRQVVRFSVQTQASGRQSGQPLNLSLLVDNSGSMQRPDRQAILKNSLQTLEERLTDQDKLNIVLFARQPRLIAEAKTRASQKAAVDSALAYRPEGGTNLEAGLQAAYESAQRNYLPAGSNRVILMTDGAANLGNINAGELADYVVEQRKQGIALDAYGIGWDDYNDALLEEITRNGDGRYAFLNSAEEASEDFSEKLAGTLRVAAANVKVQIEWNPDRVQRYRQIGYDLHQLKKEDFRDNTVDAAEIGEAESGTALYVLQIDDDPEIIGGLGTLRVRYLDPASGLYQERSWPLPMPHAVPAVSAADPSMRLAISSALFGERLANSPYASGYDLRDLYSMTSSLTDAFPNQPRVAELQTMILQASELYGDK